MSGRYSTTLLDADLNEIDVWAGVSTSLREGVEFSLENARLLAERKLERHGWTWRYAMHSMQMLWFPPTGAAKETVYVDVEYSAYAENSNHVVEVRSFTFQVNGFGPYAPDRFYLSAVT